MRVFLTLLVFSLLLSGCMVTVDDHQAIKTNHDSAARSYFELGVAYMQKGRYDLAEPKLLRSIKLKPSAEAYNALAVLYEEQHNNILAEKTYKEIMNKFPFYARGYLNYSIFLCKYHREEQLSSLVRLMSKNTKSIAALGQIAAGNCALENKHKNQARRYYTEALKYDNYAAGALLPLARLDIQEGLITAAKEKIDTVHNYIGYSASSLLLAINLAEKMAQPLVAKRMQTELIKRFPNSPQAKKLLGNK